MDADDQAAAARSFVAAKGGRVPDRVRDRARGRQRLQRRAEIGIPETFFLNARHLIVKRVLGGVTMKDLIAGVALMEGHHTALAARACADGTRIEADHRAVTSPRGSAVRRRSGAPRGRRGAHPGWLFAAAAVLLAIATRRGSGPAAVRRRGEHPDPARVPADIGRRHRVPAAGQVR